jgi:hypothetical protein
MQLGSAIMQRCVFLTASRVLCIAIGISASCAQAVESTPAQAQASFATADEAVAALVAAGQQQDGRDLQRVLGPQAAGLVSSGDPIQDRHERESFLARYRAYHELVAGSPNELVLLVGVDRWPLPIPLVRSAGRWSFDSSAGTRELLLRRIGANELHTIDVMHGFVAAQGDYAATGHDGDVPGVYAQKLRSTPGKQDGLYWEAAAGTPESPAGPLLAAASAEGYTPVQGAPYHGYLFRPLTSQGAAADGGTRNYLVSGKQRGGFALLAYPAQYGSSGIMTFIVNQDGVVWQRDLGADTARYAKAIRHFDPGEDWSPVAPQG